MTTTYNFVISWAALDAPHTGDAWLLKDFETALAHALVGDGHKVRGDNTGQVQLSGEEILLYTDPENRYFPEGRSIRVCAINDWSMVERQRKNEVLVALRYRMDELSDASHIVPIDILPSRITKGGDSDNLPAQEQAVLDKARQKASERGVPLVCLYIREGLYGEAPWEKFKSELFQKICEMSKKAELLILTGPRTPLALEDRIKRLFERYGRRTPANDKATRAQIGAQQIYAYGIENWVRPNPYIEWMRAADAVVMTSDTMSGVSDALAVGKPVTLLENNLGAQNCTEFLSPLIEAGAVRFWSGALAATQSRALPANNLVTLDIAMKEVTRRISDMARWLPEPNIAPEFPAILPVVSSAGAAATCAL